MGRLKKPYTLIKRGKVWYYRTYDSDGYRTTAKSTGCTSKIQAQQFCEKLYLSGNISRSSMTFGQFAAGFYDSDSMFVKDRSRALSWNTVYHYNCTLNSRLIPYFGKFLLADITYSELKKYRVKLREEVGDCQVNNIFAALSNILKAAYFDNLIQSNPMDRLEPLTVEVGQKVPFTLEEMKAICDNIVNYRPICVLLACTGMRISEAIGVTAEDIKQGKDFLYIDLNRQFDTRQRKYVPTKRSSDRKIPIIPELADCLQPLVPYPTLNSALNEVKSKLNIDKEKTFHSFRHFFISDTKSKDLNPIKIEYLAGHSLKKIEKIYTHLDFEKMGEILDWQKDIFDFLEKK